jgi:uncharacterized protein (DUF1800 family)
VHQYASYAIRQQTAYVKAIMREVSSVTIARAALLLALASSGCMPGAPGPARVKVTPIQSELSREQQIDHALNRLAYGSRPGDVERVRAIGLERWISMQLTPERIQDRSADSIVAAYRTLNVATSDLTVVFRDVRMARRDTSRMMSAAVRADRRALQLSITEVAAAKLARAVTSERQLYEQTVDFWENHFSVFSGKGQTRLFIPAYDRDVIRPRAMGKFRDLLGAVATSPAMLFYLDNWQSAADSTHNTLGSRPPVGRVGSRPPLRGGSAAGSNTVQRPPQRPRRGLNENYARELMELHTLGVDGGYTQQDVVEVARALTGWSLDPAEGLFVFRPAAHDADEKTVLGVRLAADRGIEDGEQVLDILARHPSTARHIARKLVVRFVSDSAPSALVDRCASVFSRSDGDIRQTLRCVVTSPEFFSKTAYRAKVKSPFELVASALRATGATPDSTTRSVQVLTRLGQPVFGRQTPDGWPERGDEWMNSGAMINRVNFALALAGGRVPGIRTPVVDPALGARLSRPEFQKR